MMSLYCFVGAHAMIWGDANNHTPSQTFDVFGQTVEMADAFAREKIHHDGLQLLPKAEFDSLGFTEDELKQYATRERQMEAPPETKAKFAATIAAFQAYRQSLKEVLA